MMKQHINKDLILSLYLQTDLYFVHSEIFKNNLRLKVKKIKNIETQKKARYSYTKGAQQWI